ncbi:hypothetical protein LUZ60_005390 [Juncus effusus]|nr:hypothetical protein LUZ60_005390 [Juncus effusus]
MRNNNAGGLASSMIKWTSQKLSALIPSSALPSSSSVPPTDAAFEDLRKLERTMKRIQAMVMTAEERGVRGQDEKLRLEELKEVAYDAEDVVDDYEFEVLSAEIKAGIHLGGNDHKPKCEHKVNHVTSSHLIVPVPSELAIRVKSVRERFDEIIREWEVLRWSEGESLRHYGVDMVKPPQSTSLVHEPSIHELDDLQRTLRNEVKGKRFLIVLDDVWNEKPSLWHTLKAPFISMCSGKIIVTTRNEKQLAFECQDPNSNPGLLEIGREIVVKCGGLPLAVKALGSLLRFEADEESWREILDSEIWELDMRNNEILPALKISFDLLIPLLITYAACIQETDPAQLLDKRVNAKRD